MFIVFEGIDGAGTTTQAALLADRLRKSGKDILQTAEPTGGPIGRLIRQTLSGATALPPRALQMLFFADRIQHLEEEIMPALAKKKIVISDRYCLSTLAYARLADDSRLFPEIARHFPAPDLTIFLDLPAKTAIKRINSRKIPKEIFEKTKSLSTIADAYHLYLKALPDKKKLMLDGTRPKEELAETIFHEVRGRSSAG